MEGKFGKGPLPPKIEQKNYIEDTMLFGRFLLASMFAAGKTKSQISAELGVNPTVISKWEQGDAFPAEERLEAVARAYAVEMVEMKRILEISKNARQKEKISRKRIDSNPRNR